MAWDLDRVDWRTFRVDRLSSCFVTGESVDLPEHPDASRMVQAALGIGAHEVQARVRLQLPHDEAARLVPATAGLLEPDGESTVWSFGGSEPARMAGWLASMPCRVEVLEPDVLAAALDRHVRVLVGRD